MKDYLPLGCWLCIFSCDIFHLWLLGALVYLTLFVIDIIENSWDVNWIPRDFTSNIISFGLISICVVCGINDTGTWALKLANSLNTAYLLGCWFRFSSGDGLHLWLLGAIVYLTLFGIDTVENSWGINWIPRDFPRNIQSFSLSSICVVCELYKTQRIQHEIKTLVGRGHFRYRIKSGAIAQYDSTQHNI